MSPRFVLPILAFLLTRVTATCYFPDGDVSPADVACDAEASDSVCCFSKQACLSNKLCLAVVDGANTYARGTCTDPTWQSGACPDFCLDQKALGNPVFSCNITGVDEYCCNDGCSCDATVGDEVVSFTGTPYTISVIGVTGTYPNPSATTSLSTTTSSSSTSETSASSSSTASTTTSDSTGPPASNTAAPATSSASSSSSASSKSSSNSVAIGAGVGVGVGVGILLIGAGAFFFYRRRARARKNTEQYAEKPDPTSTNYHTDQMGKQYPHANPSELSPAGHDYSELGTDKAHAAPPARTPDVSELPGH